MKYLIRRTANLFTLLVTLAALSLSQAAAAQGNSAGKGSGKNKNVGVGNASDGISAKIVTAKDIFYTGDPLSIALRFSRGAELVSSGEVDAYIVIFAPAPATTADDDSDSDTETDADSNAEDSTAIDTAAAIGALTDAVVLPVSDQASADEKKLFELEAVDVSALPAGTYQLGLVLTNPGGDPLVINDWFKGLLGLIDIVGLTVSDEALAADEDGDGEIDDDNDDDGFSDSTSDDSSDSTDSSDDSSSDGS